MIDRLRQDLRYAVRTWTRRPGIALVAFATLALGIGANTALFSIVNAVLLRPLPYAHADRLVTVWARTPTNPQTLVSYPEFDTFRRDSASFDALAVWLGNSVNLTGVSEPQRLMGAFASGSFFDVPRPQGGARPALHRRGQRAGLGAAGRRDLTRLLADEILRRRVRDRIDADDQRHRTHGGRRHGAAVRHERCRPTYFVNSDVNIPVGHFPVPGGPAQGGLLRAGCSASDVEAGRVDREGAGGSRRALAAPRSGGSRRAEGTHHALVSVQDTVVAGSRTPLLLLLASVGAVLLIACVNVSNLLLARAVDRQKEIALRAALGASRFAVTRQLLVEVALLAGVSAAAGLMVGRWSLQALAWLRPPSVPIPDRIPLDTTVLLFTMATAMAVAVLCGVLPALRASRLDLSRTLQAGFHRASSGGGRTRDVLVVVEVALSVVLLAMSGLLAQSLLAAQRVPLGFDADRVLTMQFRLPATKYRTPEQIARFFKTAIEQVRSAPGVTSAALVRRVPLGGNWGDTPLTAEGARRRRHGIAGRREHDPARLDARIPVVKGRTSRIA
jgi:putative ABC transport system permease protein